MNNKPREEKKEKEFVEELLSIDRVTRVTAWWRQLSFRAVVVIWDKKWRVWVWAWKSSEVVDAISKAVNRAKKDIVKVPLINGTIPHEITVKFKSASVMIHPASEWIWIIAWWAVRKVLSVAWYKNILAKRYGSKNFLNNARATIKALSSLKLDGDITKRNEEPEEVKEEKKPVDVKNDIIKEAPKAEKKEEKPADKADVKKAEEKITPKK